MKSLQPQFKRHYGWHPEKYETNLTLSGVSQLAADSFQATAGASEGIWKNAFTALDTFETASNSFTL